MLGRRLGAGAALTLLLVLATPASALAHGDDRLADGSFTLGPGGTATFDGELHYHRLAVRVDADGPVTLQLIETASERVRAAAAPSPAIRINELIRCCDDDPWTPHTLEISNPGR